jgi:hypothetical protein
LKSAKGGGEKERENAKLIRIEGGAANNYPLKGGKLSNWEGLISLPFPPPLLPLFPPSSLPLPASPPQVISL